MRLTPQQVADLRAPKNVRGGKKGRTLFLVAIAPDTFERVQALTHLGELEVVWYFDRHEGSRVHVVTDRPEWFMELEGQMDDARRHR